MSHALHVPALAILIHRFALLLMVKFHFHSQHPDYDAHYVRRKNSGNSGSSSGLENQEEIKVSNIFWEKNVNVVSRLLTMIGTSDLLQRMVLGMRTRSSIDVHLATTAESCLLPLVSVVVSCLKI